MNQRIFDLRKSLNLTQEDFGKAIGMAGTTISDIENNRCPVTEKTLIAVCSKFNVNEKWLRTGQGNMFNILDKKHDQFFEIFKDLHPALQDFLIRTARDLLDTQKKL